ncbi:solute carrier family 2, facilitated glucose transporter member 5-like isoform X1 [Clavelina lepadiformis]|uniref:solute carrier family 2, facilitated glucose transporter member 5-like isoform X1 n=2 Tax=Clavelina lepadiformis TaxID=159417 RepID=UPI0040436542
MCQIQNSRITFILVITVVASGMSSFQYGYNMAILEVNTISQIMHCKFRVHSSGDNNTCQQSCNDSNCDPMLYAPGGSPINVSAFQVGRNDGQGENGPCKSASLWLITVSIYTLGGMVGAILTGISVKIMGRKGTLLTMNPLSIIGAALMWVSDSIYVAMAARFIQGLFAGLATGVVPLYVGEISPTKIRGAVITVHQLFVTLGLLVAQALGHHKVWGNCHGWRYTLVFTAVPSLIQLLILPSLPDSPRAIFIDQNWEDGAEKSLQLFRGTDDVQAEIDEIREERDDERASGQMSEWKLICHRPSRRQLITISVVLVLQQLCGINAILLFVQNLIDSTVLKNNDIVGIGVCIANVGITVIAIILMDWVGRKRLLLGGYIFAGFSCILLAISLLLESSQYKEGLGSTQGEAQKHAAYLGLASMIGFILGFAVGPGPVPWIITVEYFRQSSRPAASTIGHFLNWLFNAAIFWIFSYLNEGTFKDKTNRAGFVVFFFMIICFLPTGFLYYFMPETKNKSFQNIYKEFSQRSRSSEDNNDNKTPTESTQNLITNTPIQASDGESVANGRGAPDSAYTAPKRLYHPTGEDTRQPREIDLRYQDGNESLTSPLTRGAQPITLRETESTSSSDNSLTTDSNQRLSTPSQSPPHNTSSFREAISAICTED